MKTGLLLFFIFCFCTAISQTPSYSSSQAPLRPGPVIYLRDVFKTHIDPKPYIGIEGSPFVDEKWLLATIKAEGRKELIDSLPIKINVYSHAVHFMDENNEEVEMGLRIEWIKIIESNSPLFNTVFLSSFSQERGFFRVIEDGGKLKLLKKQGVSILESHPLGLPTKREFIPQHDLYFSSGSVLYKPSKSCTAIHQAFDGNEKVLDYISANKLQCHKEGDMRKLVIYYATLK